MTGVVCGNAAELRSLADRLDAGDDSVTAEAEAHPRVQALAQRVKALQAKRPELTLDGVLATQVGKPRCGEYATVAEQRPVALDQDGDTAVMYVYGDIDSWGDFWGVSADEVREQLEQCTAANLIVHLNSYGGEVFEGLAIRTALQRHASRVTVTVDAIAASIASVIALSGETVAMADPSMMMIHDPWMVCVGDAAEMRKQADLLDKIGGQLAGVYAGKAGGGLDKWRDLMLAETWFGAEEAVAAGLADRVDKVVASDPMPDQPDPEEEEDEAPGYAAAASVPRAEADAAPSPDPEPTPTPDPAPAEDAPPEDPAPSPAPDEPAADDPAEPTEDTWAGAVAWLTNDNDFTTLTEALVR